jgi:hypothetical protein
MGETLPETAESTREGAVQPEEERWYFTFGFSHRLIAVDTELPKLPDNNIHRMGFNLARHYVVIKGTRESTRATMIRLFGDAWSFQYEENHFKEQMSKFDLVKLTVT